MHRYRSNPRDSDRLTQMAFRIRRIITSPKTAQANLDALPGPGTTGNLLAAQTWLRPIYLPRPVSAIAFAYWDQGIGNLDFGVYTLDFRRIFSLGTFASLNSGGSVVRKVIPVPVLLPAGRLWIGTAYSATGLGRRTVNAWPGYSQAGGPPLPAVLNPAVDDTSNFPLDISMECST